MDYSALAFNEILVRLEADSVAVVTINRAAERNSFSRGLVNELIRIFELVDKDDNIRVVILTADPTAPAFCAGADLSDGWKAPTLHNIQSATDHRDSGGRVAMAIYNCRKITISAVNGHAAGAGVTALQLPFDFRFVWSGAKITLPFVRRGVVLESLASLLLPRLIGLSRAKALLLTGATVQPDSPYMQGLYHDVLPTREEVFPASLIFAKELAANTSQVSIAYTKGLLHHPGKSIEETHLLESRALAETSKSRDAEELTRAFFERRRPNLTDTVSNNTSEWYPWWTVVDVKSRL
ncbi:enoyl-CoA hydratase/isomerase [Guyanagaster necrorhizus]|uniref:Enoyl-CoA hydratase/isomerase n=1 Tax=Guyanagaster necrorhizus TaxID=856835 RepID=A0A9P8AYV9_9AGAR|nr:enoyl-CoA hydratase/isomerase [Guyanagaster necrorhizus MCA 3950]KAG7451327.1 enoyl-CoA hydratase/isomerase [Guyanagaster necrorhizus MCA 3950]